MDLEELFDTYHEVAFRLEVLPQYDIPSERGAVKQFLELGVIPEGFNEDWLGFVRDEVASGKSIRRLRLVHDPLTDYERFELHGAFLANVEAGEEIRVIRADDFTDIQDFWAFDRQWVAFMNYTESGEFLGSTVADNASQAAQSKLKKWQDVFSTAPLLDEFR